MCKKCQVCINKSFIGNLVLDRCTWFVVTVVRLKVYVRIVINVTSLTNKPTRLFGGGFGPTGVFLTNGRPTNTFIVIVVSSWQKLSHIQ